MSIASDKQLHTSRTISWGNILVFAGLVISQLLIYGEGKLADGKNYEKIEQLIKVAEKHVDEDTLAQQMKVQEIKIQNIADDVEETKEDIKENQRMLIKLLQRTAGPNN